jgi:hypothetical protein
MTSPPPGVRTMTRALRCWSIRRFASDGPSVRGISTEVLWEHADSGANNRELVEAFDLTVSEVQWALAYENMPRAA